MSGWTILFLILVLLPVLLLAVPLAFKAGGIISPGALRLEAGVDWGWGLFSAAMGIKENKKSILLRIAGLPLPLPRGKPGKAGDRNLKNKPGRKGKKGRLRFSEVSAVLNSKLLNAVLRYIKRIMRSLRVRLRLRGVYGTGDPALTGVILALIAVMRADYANIDLNADFSGPILDVSGEISGRVAPIVILWLTLRLLLAGPVRKIWWGWLKSKFTSKKPKEVLHHV